MVLHDEHMDVRILKTGQFGDIAVEPQHIYVFPEGILGFEDLREFVLISDDSTAPFNWLLSLDEPSIGFPVLNPLYIETTYSAGREYIPPKYATVVIVTLASANGTITANMKAPVVLDVETQTGKQVILSSDKFSPNHIIGTKPRD